MMKRNKFIVIGSGRLGANIATKMSELGEDVIIIDLTEDAFRKLQESFSGYEMVGDATDLAVLESAYIKHAKAVVITTPIFTCHIFAIMSIMFLKYLLDYQILIKVNCSKVHTLKPFIPLSYP
jgi:saccharopine dehydrogenase-like NADP-dependent oxidoreductase